jgi:hypothetical protein
MIGFTIDLIGVSIYMLLGRIARNTPCPCGCEGRNHTPAENREFRRIAAAKPMPPKHTPAQLETMAKVDAEIAAITAKARRTKA